MIDSKLLEELASAEIHNNYMESKLFLSDSSIHQLSARELADLAFVSSLALYICYYQAATRGAAIRYAQKIIDYVNINNNFSTKRIMANDLYLVFHGLSDRDDSMIAGKLRPNAQSDTVWQKVSINMPIVKKMFNDMATDSMDTRGYISRALFRLETDLYVVDSTLRQLRRNAQEWYQLSPADKAYTIARIASWMETHARSMDLLSLVKTLANSKDISV